MKNIFLVLILFKFTLLHAQVETNLAIQEEFSFNSINLETARSYWVSLPANYDSTILYPVIYILDAEWRFNITSAVEKELAENGKIPSHIVIGILHPDRRRDMSFNASSVNCYGKPDAIAFNNQNSGDGLPFFKYIEEELIPEVNLNYSTSGYNILIGHSLGGYFCSYILPFQTSFKSLQIYDPSIWFNAGEVIPQIKTDLLKSTKCNIYMASSGNFNNQYAYHHKKINKLKRTLKRFPNIDIQYKNYKNERHNSMYIHSFLDGISLLYKDYKVD